MIKIQEDILKIYEDTGALQKGHFVLSSGNHSSVYLQSAIVLSYPKYLNIIAKYLITKINDIINLQKIDFVISPAMGGLIIGNKVGELLDKRSFFLERVEKIFCLRRGFEIKKNQKVLLVEDVITTGKSSFESAKCINEYGGIVLGLVSIIDRSESTIKFPFPYTSALKINSPIFSKNNVPNSLKQIPATKPGSRFIKK